jgi:hypothetical protein
MITAFPNHPAFHPSIPAKTETVSGFSQAYAIPLFDF